MNNGMNATRRSILKTGALLAAPLAAASPVAVLAEPCRPRAEDEAAIRSLHQAWLRQVNVGGCGAAAHMFADPGAALVDEGLRAVAVDHAGDPDAIDIAEDGSSAVGRFHCTVEIETALAADCTLAQMAHAQGSGIVRRSERRVLNAGYRKGRNGWAIARLDFAAA